MAPNYVVYPVNHSPFRLDITGSVWISMLFLCRSSRSSWGNPGYTTTVHCWMCKEGESLSGPSVEGL